MNELIRINRNDINGNTVNTVNARELHTFLEVGKDFSNWIKDRIEQYNFVENQDFIIFAEIGEKSGRGRPSKEYYLSIDMAKELAMVERNEKGKQARQYFIECERRANNPIELLNDPAQLRSLLANYSEKVIALESKVAEQAPKVEALDRIARADGGLNLTNTAKNLNVRPKDLFGFLQANKWIYRRVGGKNFVAYQDKIQAGLLTHKVYTVTLDDGAERVNEQVIVTPKGLAKLSAILPLHDPLPCFAVDD